LNANRTAQVKKSKPPVRSKNAIPKKVPLKGFDKELNQNLPRGGRLTRELEKGGEGESGTPWAMRGRRLIRKINKERSETGQL